MLRSFLKITLILLGAFACLLPTLAQAQEKPEFSAESLEQIVINNEKVRKFTGNVIVKLKGQTIYAPEGFQYPEPNERTVLRGGVRIEQPDGKFITGDSLIFRDAPGGGPRLANIRGHVLYQETGRSLITDALDYDPESGTAIYTTGGTIVDNGTTLTSRRGRYVKATGQMYFYGAVKMTGAEYTLTTDSLHYNSQSKQADFFGPTTIVNQDGTVNTTRGSYNTGTGKGLFTGRSFVVSPDYRLTGDLLDFDRANGGGYARGNVELFTKQDSVTILGDRAFYNRAKGTARIYGNSLIKAPAGSGDTLYIRSDSMTAVSDTLTKTRVLLAKSRVKIFQGAFQGRCDSLAYSSQDSTIRFYRDPVLWSGKNQSTGDTIYAKLKENKIDSLILIRNAMIISLDTMGHYNQVKGRFILADFDSNRIKKAYVRGNGQSIYHAVDEQKLTYTGMNRIECSNMVIRFDSSKLKTITALVKPEARFIPPHEIVEPEKKLKGFAWRNEERPSLAMVLTRPSASKNGPPVGKSKKPTIIKPSKAKKRPSVRARPRLG